MLFTFTKLTNLFTALAILSLAILSSAAFAQQNANQQEFNQALQELSESISTEGVDSQIKTGGATAMSCIVDTIAYDTESIGYCESSGSARIATAIFRIVNPPANYGVNWSDSRCTTNSLTCAVPIVNYRTITMSATVLNNANNTFVTVSATAHYEGLN